RSQGDVLEKRERHPWLCKLLDNSRQAFQGDATNHAVLDPSFFRPYRSVTMYSARTASVAASRAWWEIGLETELRSSHAARFAWLDGVWPASTAVLTPAARVSSIAPPSLCSKPSTCP